jgi:predicted outer membrane lipoprotein
MTMNCNATHAAALPAAASRSVTVRPAEFSTAWIEAFAKIRTLWQEHVERTKKARAQAAFASIDEHTLRDIGAPNWIIAEAAHREDSRGLRLIDLYRS